MKTFTRSYRITGGYPEPFSRYMSGLRPCILDIETTGLDPSKCKVCLVALLTRTDSGVTITQFLAENHYEENRVLAATMDFLEREEINCLITFNGRAFDIPFLNTRLKRNFYDGSIRMYDFDLYRFLSRAAGFRSRLPSLSQKSIENYYGILGDRKDTITGKESVALFDEYALRGDSVIEKILLTHNREDVLHLHRLMFLCMDDVEDMDASMCEYGFPVLDGCYSVRARIVKSAGLLKITGEQFGKAVSASFYPDIDDPLRVVFNAASSSYEIDVPLGRHDDTYYADIKALGLDADDDPDCVNGYLVLCPRTVSLLAGMTMRKVITERILG